MSAGGRARSLGLPRMHKEKGELRDFLPGLVESVADLGVEVVVESGIGSGMGLSDADYLQTGPNVRPGSNEEALAQDVVLVLRSPDDRYQALSRGATLISMLHYPTRPRRVARLMNLGLEASRVLRSNIHLLGKLGADVWVSAPRTLIPPGIERLGVTATTRVEDAIAGADVVMMLRIQMERMQGHFFPSLREYFNLYGLTRARLALAAPDAIVMHPGPMNRGVEIDSDVADGPASVILEQVANGVAVRMAVLYLLAGGLDN
jgi:hypothetical protein